LTVHKQEEIKHIMGLPRQEKEETGITGEEHHPRTNGGLPEAFDAHFHLDGSLNKYGLPPTTSLGTFLRGLDSL